MPYMSVTRCTARFGSVSAGRCGCSGCEIAKLLSHGLSNRDIAEAMSVSVRTVEGHIYQASAKAGVSSRSELAKLVQRFTELEVGSERG
jgi:DNA-binding CsgD family transcriptional regulator